MKNKHLVDKNAKAIYKKLFKILENKIEDRSLNNKVLEVQYLAIELMERLENDGKLKRIAA